MARILVDDFASGLISGHWATMNPTPSIITAKDGMSGSYCLQLSGAASVRGTLPSEVSDLRMAFKYHQLEVTYSYQCNVVTFLNASGGFLGQLNVESSSRPGRFYFCRGEAGTTLGTAQFCWFEVGKTALVEVRYKPDTGSGGELRVRVNGREVISFSGQTADVSGSVAAIHLGWVDNSNWQSHFCLGDLVIDDVAFPGMTLFSKMSPTAAGNSAQWSPSSGSNWDCVDEVPGTFDQYVGEDTDGQIDLYTMEDPALPPSVGAILGMQVTALTRKLGTPSADKVKLALRTNSTNFLSSAKTPGTDSTPKSVSNYWGNNPYTETAWDAGALNSLEVGVSASA